MNNGSAQTLNWISPRSLSGSFLISVMIHGSFVFALVAILSASLSPKTITDEYLDLGYQTFDEPPVPVQQENKVQHVPEPIQAVSKVSQPNAPSEIQDDKGEVTGSQEATQENKVSSDSPGSATSTPYYRIKPKYPKAALASGTEGWVMMQIDINETGEVENVRVVDGEQRNLFQSEARRAVSQWKYRPFLDGAGKAARKMDHQVRVDFKLKEASSVE